MRSVGEWQIDPDRGILRRDRVEVRLRRRAMDVLMYLVERPGKLVRKDELLEAFWRGTFESDNAVSKVISDLRKAFDDPSYIENRHGFGYILTAPVSDETPTRHVPVEDIAGPEDASNSKPAVAVLPFENSSNDQALDHVADSLPHEIWDQLCHLDSIDLISMRSSSMFKNDNVDVREVGARLNARYLVDGSLGGIGSRSMVRVQLIDATTGTRVWSQSYERNFDSVESFISLCVDAANSIATALEELHGLQPHARLQSHLPTTSVEAYKLYQLGVITFVSTANPIKALPPIEEALKLDPDFENALALKASMLYTRGDFGYAPARKSFDEALAFAREILERFPHLEGVRWIFAHYLVKKLDFIGAEQVFNALEVRPHQLERLHYCVFTGRYSEGLELAVRDEQLNPLDVGTKIQMGRFLYRLGRNADASAKFEEALKLAPRNAWVLNTILTHYIYETEDISRAEQIVNESVQGSAMIQWAHDAIALKRGNPEPLRRRIEKLINRNEYVSPYLIALDAYHLGDYATHILWFKKQVEDLSALDAMPDFWRMNPDYWPNLERWAEEAPEQAEKRRALVDEHRKLVEEVTERAVMFEEPVRVAIAQSSAESLTPVSAPSTEAADPVDRRMTISSAAAIVLMTTVVLAVFYWPKPETRTQTIDLRTVVVLPFENLTSDRDLDSVAHSFAPKIRANLAQWDVPTVKSVEFIGSQPELGRDAGTRANAEYLIAGSLVSGGGALTVTAELIRAHDGVQLWSKRYDEGVIAPTMDEVPDAIAYTSRYWLLIDAQEREIRFSFPNVDPAAADLFFHTWREYADLANGRGGSWSVLVEQFEKVYELDPEFWIVNYFIAQGYVRLVSEVGVEAASQRGHAALDRMPDLPAPLEGIALTQRAQLFLNVDLDYSAAARTMNDIQGVLARPHGIASALIFLYQGKRQEALAAVDLARTEDYMEEALVATMSIAAIYEILGEHRDALDAWQKSLFLADTPRLRAYIQREMAWCEAHRGNVDKANRLADKAWALIGNDEASRFIALFALMGRQKEAERVYLDWLASNSKLRTLGLVGDSYNLDAIRNHLAMRREDLAFPLIRQAIDERDVAVLAGLRLSALYDPYRSDPRFKAVMDYLEQQEADST